MYMGRATQGRPHQTGNRHMTSYEHKAATFNGNVIIGKGATPEQAYEEARKAAYAMGSCVRKTISVAVIHD